jgi:HEPN domain-containing protein
MKPREDPEVQAWLAKAAEDLAAARILAQHAPYLDTVVGFHCQQAVEKSLKAALVVADVDPPKTHDLDVLLARLLQLMPVLSAMQEAASYLNGYSVVPRYPAFQPHSDDRESRSHRAMTLASDAVELITQALAPGETA